MTALALAFHLLMPFPGAPSLPVWQPEPVEGTWSQYGLSPSQGQIWYHSTVTGKLRNPERYDGFIAVLDCELVGEDAWIQVYPLKRWQHVQVLDCSGHQSTTRWFRSAGIIGELFYKLARKNGVPIGRGVTGAITFTRPQEVTRGTVGVDNGDYVDVAGDSDTRGVAGRALAGGAERMEATR